MKGFTNFPLANVQLNFRREALKPAQVVQRFQEMVDALQEARDLEARCQVVAKAAQKAMPGYQAFYDEAVAVVRTHFGSDRRVLASFGLRVESGRGGRR
jgi:hypothetical protein